MIQQNWLLGLESNKRLRQTRNLQRPVSANRNQISSYIQLQFKGISRNKSEGTTSQQSSLDRSINLNSLKSSDSQQYQSSKSGKSISQLLKLHSYVNPKENNKQCLEIITKQRYQYNGAMKLIDRSNSESSMSVQSVNNKDYKEEKHRRLKQKKEQSYGLTRKVKQKSTIKESELVVKHGMFDYDLTALETDETN